MRSAPPAAVRALCSVVTACVVVGCDDLTGLKRLARHGGLVSDPEAFFDAARLVGTDDEILIAVRDDTVPPLDPRSLRKDLEENGIEDVVLLPRTSFTSGRTREKVRGRAPASDFARAAIVDVFRSRGWLFTSTFSASPIVNVTLPANKARAVALLEALVAHPNFDTATPNDSRGPSPD